MHFHGMKIYVVSDPRRYYDLPADVLVPAEFRAEFNEWSRRFFPPDPALNIIADGEALMLGDRQAHMNARTYAHLKIALAEEPRR